MRRVQVAVAGVVLSTVMGVGYAQAQDTTPTTVPTVCTRDGQPIDCDVLTGNEPTVTTTLASTPTAPTARPIRGQVTFTG